MPPSTTHTTGAPASPTVITSDEVNYLIYRYLLESGYSHTLFTFQHESAIHKSRAALKGASMVPPGALISFLTKGLQYMEVEMHALEDGTEKMCLAPFSLISAHECHEIPHPPSHAANNHHKYQDKYSSGMNEEDTEDVGMRDDDYGRNEPPFHSRQIPSLQQPQSPKASALSRQKSMGDFGTSRNMDEPPPPPPVKETKKKSGPSASSRKTTDGSSATNETSAAKAQSSSLVTTTNERRKSRRLSGPPTVDEPEPEMADVDMASPDVSMTDSIANATIVESFKVQKTPGNDSSNAPQIPSHHALILTGHTSEVFASAWNFSTTLLATGSGDGTARIWRIPNFPSDEASSLVLAHDITDGSNDVTTLEWNTGKSSASGEDLLATGSYDGIARIWDATGKCRFIMRRHDGPIFVIKWNKKGDLLLTGGVDKSAIVWDALTGEPRQQFEFHSSPTLDVDWRSDGISFATCGTDKQIFVCELGSLGPIRHFEGHEDEVNAIKWNASSTLLASCSDDRTAKVWSMESSTPVCDLVGHEKEIYILKWGPSGAPNMLATASFDSTLRVWDVSRNSCRYVLSKHQDAVYAVDFSPSGAYLASGSFDQYLYIWSMADGSLFRSYKGTSSIFDVCWSPTGDKICVCFADNTIAVLYLDDLL